MKTGTREMVAGGAAACGFVVAAIPLGMPLLLATGAGAATYLGFRLLLPVDRDPQQVMVAPGISAQELDNFLAPCRSSLAAIKVLIPRIPKEAFRGQLDNLAALAHTLMTNFEQQPQQIFYAGAFPHHLSQLVTIVQRYVDLSERGRGNASAERTLEAVEGIVTKAYQGFEKMRDQQLRADVQALEISAGVLDELLEMASDSNDKKTI